MDNFSSQMEIFTQADDPVLLCDGAGRILLANPAACKALKYSPEQLPGLRLNDLMVSAAAAELLQPGLYETRWVRRDKSELPLEVRVSRINRKSETALLLVARDISERRNEEVRLQTKNDLLHNILANIPHSIYWKNRDLAYEGGNANFARDVGLETPEQLIGRTVHDLPCGSENASVFQQCDREVMEKDFPLLDLEEQRQRKDGRTATLLTSRVPLKDAAGRVNGVLGIYTDITERRRAEAALEKSESRHKRLSQEFQTVLHGIPDSLMLLSPDLRVVWSNRSSATLLGQTYEAIPGQYCYQLWNQQDQPCADCVVRQCFDSGETKEVVRQYPDGRIWGIKVFPIKDAQGEVVNVIHLASDITDKKRLRDEADRAGRLAALGELSAGVAHEINNPNGLILLNLPLLEDVFTDALPILEQKFQQTGDFELAGLPYSLVRDDLPRLFAELKEGAQRIRQIVDDLKNFVSRNPFDKQETFSISTSIEKVIRLARNTLKKTTDNFSCQVADALPLAVGNAAQIEQVILNLLLNSCNALQDRQCHIGLQVKTDDTGENLIITVTDQGCGIDAADLPHVTDPFFTTRREEGGTGLGLSIAARIVKEHDG